MSGLGSVDGGSQENAESNKKTTRRDKKKITNRAYKRRHAEAIKISLILKIPIAEARKQAGIAPVNNR